MTLISPNDFSNHIKHCIQEEHGIILSPKAVQDIKNTVLGAHNHAIKGATSRAHDFEVRYYEQKIMHELLIKSLKGCEYGQYKKYPIERDQHLQGT